jgi:hypothetical protein
MASMLNSSPSGGGAPRAQSTTQPVEIVECKTRPEVRQFITFQWEIYAGDPHWVPPLMSERMAFYDKAKNPFFEHSDAALFLARRAGRIVGTIAAVLNTRHNLVHGETTGFFGGFECIDDDAVARALFDAAGGWLKARGMTVLRGPATLSTNDEVGLLVEGFDSAPQVLMTYNPPYYAGLIERCGFVKAMDLLAWWVQTDIASEAMSGGKYERVVNAVMKRGKFTVRNVDIKHFETEIERLKAIYSGAWEKNWGFVPLTEHELHHLANNLKQIADPDFVFVAEVNGEPVGFSVALPDVNQALRLAYPRPNVLEWWTLLKFLWHRRKAVNRLRVLLLGLLPQYRASGMEAVMTYKTLEVAMRKGIVGAEMSWILETNDAMNRINKLVGGRVYKRYRMYDAPIA